MRAAALALMALAARAEAAAPREVLSGIDTLAAEGFASLKGLRVGLITNHTGLDRRGRRTADLLASAPGVRLEALFSPEHGFSGIVDEGAVSSGSFRTADGRLIPLFSLYGATRAPTAGMLRGLDALLFDVQDVGARFYTYPATMAMALESAAAAGIEFVVLDRPDPVNGEAVQGPVPDEGVRFFTAYLPVAVRHGMTVGELARLHNAGVGARLRVVPMKGWSRKMWFDQTALPWTRPSPNMPDLDSAALYPGTCFFEASNLSVGRGTPAPFRWLGAPWLDPEAVLRRLEAARLRGYAFEAAEFTPSKSEFAGMACKGVLIRTLDRDAADPLRLFAHLLCALRDSHPREFRVRFDEMLRLAATGAVRRLYESGSGPEEFIAEFESQAAGFKSRRKPFLMY